VGFSSTGCRLNVTSLMVILFSLYAYLKLRVVLGAMIRYITFMCITEICCSRREESLNVGY
jgi:hypothetical protein